MCSKLILVTGASGYLGGHLCRALLDHGYTVRALVRPTSDISFLPLPSSSFHLCFGDITDISTLLPAFSDCHVIFHCAALVEPWLPNPSRFFTVNVEGLKNVIEAYKANNLSIEKIIYTSSFFALGPTDGGFVADENQVHHEKFYCTEYERSKVASDKIALQAASQGVPIIPVYPGVIYGPGKLTAGNVVTNLLIERFNWRLPGYIGPGNDRYSFSYIEDVVYGHIMAMEKGCIGERYLLTGENASFKYVFDAAAITTNTSKPRFCLPMWVIEVYGWISVLFSRVTGKLPLLSPPTVKVLRHQWSYSCSKAKKELSYNPRNLKDGLEELLSWLKKTGHIKY